MVILTNLSSLAFPLTKSETLILDNGLTVVARSLSGSRLVAIQLWVKGGLLAEGEFLGSGISHYLEHMLFKGTAKRGPGEIAREIHRLGGEINAATSLDYTCYKIILPREHLEKGLEIMAEAIQYPSFPEEELQREREVILREINMNRDDPDRRLWKAFLREAFTSHPYGQPILGQKEFFKNLKREDLINFHKTRYLPQLMVLSISGGIEGEPLKDKVKTCFGDWIVNYNRPWTNFTEPRQLSPRYFSEIFPAEKAYLRLGFHIPGLESEEIFSLDLLGFILGQGASSRLYAELKEKKGLADSIGAVSFTPSSQGLLTIAAVASPENLKLLEEAILQEIEKIKKEGVKEEELQRVRKVIQSEFNLSREKVEEVAGEIGYNRLILGEADFGDYYLKRLSRVKKEEIRAIAKKYLTQENLTVVILSSDKKEEKERNLNQVGDRVIHKTVLSPPLTLLSSPSDGSPMASLYLIYQGGALVEDKERQGLFSLLSRMLIRSTKKKSYLELQEEIESRGAYLSSYSGYNSFGLSLRLAKDDLPWGLELMAVLLREPVFKEEDISKVKDELEAELKLEEDNILTRAFYLFRETIFNGHPYAWRDKGTVETIRRLNRQDLLSAYQNFCLQQLPVLAVFGDIDEEEVIKFAEKKFNFFKPLEIKPKSWPEPHPASTRRDLTLPREQAIIVFGYPGVSLKDEDRFTLDVMIAILSGQSGRLFTAVREKKGEAYYVGAYQIAGLVPGALVFYAGTIPEKALEIEGEMLRELERLKAEEISSSELEKAREQLIGHKRISLEGNAELAMESALNELYGLGFNFYLDYENKIRKVDAAMIKRVAQRYLKEELRACLIINSQDSISRSLPK